MSFILEDKEPVKKYYPMRGKLGTVAKLSCSDGIVRTYCRKLRGDRCILGYSRAGFKAKDFDAEAVFSNDTTSPFIEIPAVIANTLRISNRHLSASDMAVFFRLFAHARVHGFDEYEHEISIGAIADYLGFPSIQRVREILLRLKDERSIASYHFNHGASRGRVELPLVSIHTSDEEILGLRRKDTVAFSFPMEVRIAVDNSKGYGLVDINAFPRFKSKFTALTFVKLSYIAGQLECKRKPLSLDRKGFVEALSMDPATKPNVLKATVDTIIRDLESLDGPRKRFSVEVEYPNEDDVTLKHVFTPSSSIRKLIDIDPLRVSKAVIEELESTETPMAKLYPLSNEELPSTGNILRAARLIEVPPVEILDQWRMALRMASHIVGMTSYEFKGLIRSEGVLPLFEAFIAHHDFSPFHPDMSRVHVAEQKPNTRPLKYVPKPCVLETFVQCFSEPEEVPEYDMLTAADMGFVEPPEDLPSQFGPPAYALEVDDDEIAF